MGMYKVGNTYFDDKVPIGTKIKFAGEKQAYTVQASNHFVSVCTKPFNARKTVLYCIVDWHEQKRSPENLVFGFGAKTREQCEEMLERITQGQTDLSHRHIADLEIESYQLPNGVRGIQVNESKAEFPNKALNSLKDEK